MDYVINMITQYGLLAIFLVILLEYACLPLPSEIVLPFAGAIAVGGEINFFLLLIVSIIAGLLGSLICYAIGRSGGVAILHKITTKFPKAKKGIDAFCVKFEKYANVSVGVARVIPLCRTYISFVSGAYKQSVLSFITSSLIGISVWNTMLIGFGYLLGDNWRLVVVYYYRFKFIIIPVVIVAFLFFVVKAIIKNKSKCKSK